MCTNRVTKYYDVAPSGWPETKYVPKKFFFRDDKYRKNDSVYFRILYQQNYKDIYKMGDLIISCVSAAVAFKILPLLLLKMFQCTTCTVNLVKWTCLVVSGVFVVQSVIGGIMWAMLSWITDWTFIKVSDIALHMHVTFKKELVSILFGSVVAKVLVIDLFSMPWSNWLI